MSRNLRIFIGGFAGAFAALMAVQALQAADNAGSSGTIPFRATLDKDGEPFSGEVDMRFSLYDAESGGTKWWSEEHSPSAASGRPRVNVYRGELVVALGTYDDGGLAELVDVLADAEPMWLEVEVRLAGEASYTKLMGRQRLTAAPYAVAASEMAAPTLTSLAVSGSSGGGDGLFSDFVADLDADIQMTAQSARLGVGIADLVGQAGPHQVVFGDPGTGTDDGGALRYDTTSNVLELERVSDGTNAFSLDLDDGTFTTRGQLQSAVTTQDTSTSAGQVTLGASADLALDTVASITFTASSANNGIALGDNGSGLQVVYNPTADDFSIEAGAASQSATLADGADIFVVDRNGGNIGVKGDLVTGGYAAPTPGTWSNPTTLESNGLDKVFQSDTSCTAGHVRVAKNGGRFVSLCVCLGASVDQGRGYYCFD